MKRLSAKCSLIALVLGLGASLFGTAPTPPPAGNAWSGDTQIIGLTSAGVPVYVQVDAAGVLQVSSGGGGGGGTSSNFAAAFPTAGSAIGVKDSAGVNMTFLKVNASNGLVVDGSAVTQPVSQGTAGAVTAGWPFINGELGDTTGTFTNGTQTTSITTGGSIDGYDTATISINGTYGTATAVFEGSDDGGTTWYGIQGARSNAGVVEGGYTSLTNTSQVWFVSTQGFDALRVRSTAVTSGTVNVRISISSSPTVSSTIAQLSAGTAVIGVVGNTQGSTTSGQSGPLIQGAVTTAAPAYSNTQTSPLSLTTAGALRHDFSSVNGTTALTGTGVSGAGAIRVTVSSDSSLAANQSSNVAQINGVTPLMGNGVTGTGSMRVTLASDTTSNTNALLFTIGTAATSAGKAEDAASASADTGIFALGVRADAPVAAGTTNANGDYSQVSVNKWGAVQTVPMQHTARSYAGSVSALASVASATDIATITGNASTTVYVTRITISATQTTGGQVRVDLVKRSAANTAGSSASITAIPLDATDAAASATLLSYTANPTPGAAVGTVKTALIAVGGTTSTTSDVQVFDFGINGKPLTLSGTAQVLAVNLAGVTVTGGSFYVTFEWYEI